MTRAFLTRHHQILCALAENLLVILIILGAFTACAIFAGA